MIYTENIDNLYVPMCIQPDKGVIISSDILYSIYNTIPNYKAIIVKRDKSNRIYTTDNNFLLKSAALLVTLSPPGKTPSLLTPL